MPTLRSVTVKSAGGDYSTLAGAESGEQGDLPSLDRQTEIVCYALTDTSQVTITGWTTDATRYLYIHTATGEGQSGVWDASKYNLSVGTNLQSALLNNEDYVRIEGLQIEQTHATGALSGIDVNSTAAAASSDIRIDRCIIRNCGSSSQPNIRGVTGKVTIRNTITYGNKTGLGINCAGATMNCDNVTSVANTTYGFGRSSGTLTLRNCYSGGNTTDAYNGTMTRTTCMHDTATVFTGSTASKAYDTSNFTNVTAGSRDLHLVSGSALIDQGTDLSSDFTVDIDNVARSGTWDIGADEYVPAGGPVIPVFMCQYRQRWC